MLKVHSTYGNEKFSYDNTFDEIYYDINLYFRKINIVSFYAKKKQKIENYYVDIIDFWLEFICIFRFEKWF